MTTAAPIARMTSAAFLEWERLQSDKHQLLGGEVFAMAGGSPRHNRLSARVGALLEASLPAGCRTFSSDQKVFIPASGNFVYPDVTVVCGAISLAPGASDVIDNPRVVVEVLSASTEQHDRGDKWQDYRSVASLTDYVLVSQRLARVEHFGRESDGSWRYRAFGPGDVLELTNGTTLAVDELFEGVSEIPGEG
jgi:Uma2 family endonuclease